MLRYYAPHLIFFTVWCFTVVPLLVWHYRKHPHPIFRPSIGEMSMLTIMCALIGGGGSFFMGTMFRSDLDTQKLTEKPAIDSGNAGRHKNSDDASANRSGDDDSGKTRQERRLDRTSK